MAVNPRSELLQVLKRWMSVVLHPYSQDRDAKIWCDWRNPQIDEPNAVMEAEQALVFLFAQDALKDFRLEAIPSSVERSWRLTLEEVAPGDSYSDVLMLILSYLRDALTRVRDGERQIFTARTYFEDGSPLAASPVVDAYSLSVTLCLAAKRLARRIRMGDPDADPSKPLLKLADEVMELADARLTAALRGLLASFSVKTAPADSWHASSKHGRGLWGWPGEENDEAPGDGLTCDRLRKIKKRLSDLGFKIGKGEGFECGWSWGPIRRSDTDMRWLYGSGRDANAFDAGVWRAVADYSASIEKPAENAPYLYFTVISLDAMEDLLAPDVEASGLLNGEQTLLASRLKTLESIVRDFWEALATSKPREDSYRDWLVERLPWRTADGQSSLYWNLYLTRIIAPRLPRSDANDERMLRLCERMAEAMLILREPVPSAEDPALQLHWPGLLIDLVYLKDQDETGRAEYVNCEDAWVAYDASVQLFKLCGRLMSSANSPKATLRWIALIEEIWSHLKRRQDHHSLAGRGWDRFDEVFPDYFSSLVDAKVFDVHGGTTLSPWRMAEGADGPGDVDPVASWYITERVVEGLVSLAKAKGASHKGSAEVRRLAQALLVELEGEVRDAPWLDDLRAKTETDPGAALVTLLAKFPSKNEGLD